MCYKYIFAYIFRRLLHLLLQQNMPVWNNLNQTLCSVALCSAAISWALFSIQMDAVESDQRSVPLHA